MARIVSGTPALLQYAANCVAGDAVGNAVFITADAVLGKLQVATCDPSDIAKMPAVGVIASKSSPTDCLVILGGVWTTAGVVPDGKYLVGSAGALALPPVPGTRPFIVQYVGFGLSTTQILIQPSLSLTRFQ